MCCEYGYINSPIGHIVMAEQGNFIIAIDFCEKDELSKFDFVLDNSTLENCKLEMQQYFSGERKHFSVPIKYETTEFRRKCYDALREVPYGEVATYKDIATNIGNQKACRAVGLANNKNKLPIIVPCHRIIGSSGKMVGYDGGIWRKEWLLNLEKTHKYS